MQHDQASVPVSAYQKMNIEYRVSGIHAQQGYLVVTHAPLSWLRCDLQSA
jgi:hypothetical protein